jgi:hypothetical protein
VQKIIQSYKLQDLKIFAFGNIYKTLVIPILPGTHFTDYFAVVENGSQTQTLQVIQQFFILIWNSSLPRNH